MNFTYKIENYYPADGRLFVTYTPEDTTLLPMGAWVSITSDLDAQGVANTIIASVPSFRPAIAHSQVAASMVGMQGTGAKPALNPPTPTHEQIKQGFEDAIQHRLNDFAITRNYDGILSVCTYITSSVPQFAADAQYCVVQRDATWAKAYEILNAVQAGTRPMPTIDEVLSEMPVLEWPQ